MLRDLDVDLPPGQARVLVAIAAWPGMTPPSIRELMAALGFSSTHAVHEHVRALRRKGCLAPNDGALSRAYVPTVVPTVR